MDQNLVRSMRSRCSLDNNQAVTFKIAHGRLLDIDFLLSFCMILAENS